MHLDVIRCTAFRFLLLHVLACMWFAVVFGPSEASLDLVDVTSLDAEFFEQYVMSMHWALGHFTTAPTDLVPKLDSSNFRLIVQRLQIEESINVLMNYSAFFQILLLIQKK